MWTEDDVRVMHWQRLTERVKALPLDTIYRWLLVSASAMMLVFSTLAILHYAMTGVATLVAWLWSLV